MPEDILNADYWRGRLQGAHKDNLHHAIFRCSKEKWLKIEAKHREILASCINDSDSIFDAGCGWGRLLSLLPATWQGRYLGVDLSPDFVHLARAHYPDRAFVVADLRQVASLNCIDLNNKYDWAVLISIRPMMRRNLGNWEWLNVEREVRKVAKKLLYLEYDEHDQGSIE